jgi:hypothetical protein
MSVHRRRPEIIGAWSNGAIDPMQTFAMSDKKAPDDAGALELLRAKLISGDDSFSIPNATYILLMS